MPWYTKVFTSTTTAPPPFSYQVQFQFELELILRFSSSAKVYFYITNFTIYYFTLLYLLLLWTRTVWTKRRKDRTGFSVRKLKKNLLSGRVQHGIGGAIENKMLEKDFVIELRFTYHVLLNSNSYDFERMCIDIDSWSNESNKNHVSLFFCGKNVCMIS